MHAVNMESVFAGVKHLDALADRWYQPDVDEYWQKHRLETVQKEQTVRRAAAAAGVVGGGCCLVGVATSERSWVGEWLGTAITRTQLLMASVACGHMVGHATKILCDGYQDSRLKRDEKFKDWAETKASTRRRKAREQLRQNLDQIMLQMGVVDPNFRCSQTRTFMSDPATYPQGGYFDKSCLSAHREDENGTVTLSQGRVDVRVIKSGLRCKALRADALKLRARCVQGLLEEDNRYRTWRLSYTRKAALEALQQYLESEVRRVHDAILKKCGKKAKWAALGEEVSDYSLNELERLQRKTQRAMQDPDYFPTATRRNRQLRWGRTTYSG